jgi:hypothetical protein
MVLSYEGRSHGRPSHDEKHELHILERRDDLQPPVATALHLLAITPKRYALGFETVSKVAGLHSAIAARV